MNNIYQNCKSISMQTRNVNKFLESIILWDICKWQGTSLVSEWPPYPIGHNTDPSLMLVTTFMCPRLTVTEKFLDLHLDDLHWESPWYSSIYWCWVTSMSTCVHPLIVKLFNYTQTWRVETITHHLINHMVIISIKYWRWRNHELQFT